MYVAEATRLLYEEAAIPASGRVSPMPKTVRRVEEAFGLVFQGFFVPPVARIRLKRKSRKTHEKPRLKCSSVPSFRFRSWLPSPLVPPFVPLIALP